MSELCARDFDQVLAGGQQQFGLVSIGPTGQFVQFIVAVVVMIGEVPRVDRIESGVEGFGVPDPTEGQHSRFIQCIQAECGAIAVDQPGWLEGDFGNSFVVDPCRQPIFELLVAIGIDLIDSCQDDERGTPECREWFSEQSARQKVSVSERAGGVDQDDVEASSEASVLEPVVEDQYITVVLGDGLSGTGHSVGVLDVRCPGAECFEQSFFVVARIGPAIGVIVWPSVATTKQSDLMSGVGQMVCQPGDQWSLAGATGGQVADTQDRDISRVCRECIGVVGEVSGRDGGVVGPFGEPQQGSEPSGNRATAFSGDQCTEVGFVHGEGDTRIGRGRPAGMVSCRG